MKILTTKNTLTVFATKIFNSIIDRTENNSFETFPSEIKKLNLNTTNDIDVGDKIIWIEAIFTGSYRSAKCDGYKLHISEIIKDSYGAQSGQHTFTLKDVITGETSRRKGRTIFQYMRHIY